MLAAAIILSLAAVASADQVGDLVPVDTDIALLCVPSSAGASPKLLSDLSAGSPWSWVDPYNGDDNAKFRLYSTSSIRNPTSDIFRPLTVCRDPNNPIIVSGGFNTGFVSEDDLTDAGLNKAIMSWELDYGYQVTYFNEAGDNETSTDPAVDLCGGPWAQAITSLKIEDLNYFYILSTMQGSYAQLYNITNNKIYDTSSPASDAAFKYTAGQIISPFFDLGLNCDVDGDAIASESPSTLRILVETEFSENSFSVTNDAETELTITMNWVQDRGLFLCDVTLPQPDADIGTFTLIGCSSNAMDGTFLSVDNPYFTIKYTPGANYLTSGTAFDYTFNNGPFVFSGQFNLAVIEPSPSTSPSPSFSTSASPSISTSASPSVSAEASPSASVEPSPSVSAEASPSISAEASPSSASSSSPSASVEPSPSTLPSTVPESSPEVEPTVQPSVVPNSSSLPQEAGANPSAALNGNSNSVTLTIGLVIGLGGPLIIVGIVGVTYLVRKSRASEKQRFELRDL